MKLKFKAILIVIVSVVLFLVGYKEMKPISDEQKMESMIAALEERCKSRAVVMVSARNENNF